MPPKRHDSEFQPLDKAALQLQVNGFLEKLRSQDSEEYIQAVTDLWVIEDDIKRYLEMGEARRSEDFELMINTQSDIESMQRSKIRYLVLFSLSDAELNKILETIPECEARKQGFENYEQKIEFVETLLLRYLELCKHHYYSTWGVISWENLISRINQYSVLRYHAHVEPDGEFAPETILYFREDLMECSLSDLTHVVKGLEEGEQKMIKVMYITPNKEES